MIPRLSILAAIGVMLTPADSESQTVTSLLRVRVVEDTLPIDGATVRVGSAGALTNAAGQAALRVPNGTHQLIASRIGFVPETLTVTVGRDTLVLLTLEAISSALGAVIVTATRAERRIEEEPIRVEVIAREEIEEKLLMTPGDITMMLNETSGLRVQTTSPALGGANVRIQGLRGRYTLMLSDGLPLYGGQTGSLGLLQIPPMDLGQVEIIKGAASALYGASALGGVINLVSRRPAPVRELLLNQTSKHGTDVVVYVSDSIARMMGYSALIGGHRQQAVDIDGDGWADLAGYDRLVARPRWFWGNGHGSTAFVTAGLTVENRNGGTLAGETAPDGQPFREGLRTMRGDGGAVVRRLKGAWLLSGRGSISSQRHRHQFGSVIERDLHGTIFSEATATRSGVRHTLITGAAFQRDVYRATEVAGFNFSYNQPSLFVADDYDVASWLRLSASGRADFHSEYGSIVTPRLSALLSGLGWTMRVSAGGGAFTPTPFIEETEVTGLSRVVAPIKLDVERATGASVDVGRVVGPVELNGTAFRSRISRPVSTRVDASNNLELINAERPTETSGGEFLARLRWEPFVLTATYTLLRSTEEDAETGLRRPVPLTPRHSIGTVAMWEREGASRVGLELYYTGAQELDDNPYRDRSPDYLIIGALVEQRVGRARLFVNAENLGDVRPTRYHPIVLPARGRAGRWTTDVWSPVEGRTVNGGVRVDF